MKRLGEAELEIMLHIWEAGEPGLDSAGGTHGPALLVKPLFFLPDFINAYP